MKYIDKYIHIQFIMSTYPELRDKFIHGKKLCGKFQ